ncbi:MAG: glycosyltransferase family 2 protein [Marinibacterium sp.]|nr:glycosyltransferase family 2 protein [Marinibacterium sp.]
MVTMPDALPADSKVLVVIPTLNEADHIADVLRALIGGDALCARSDVVVADGGSDDGTQDIVRGLQGTFPNLRLVDNPGRLQAAAMNLFLAPDYDDIDILIRCDAHASYPPGYVSALVTSLRAQGAASVVVPMDAMNGEGCFQKGLTWIADSKLGAGGSPHRGGRQSGFVDHGHHAAFRMDVFRALGGYDARFVANEDAEYDARVIAAGHRIWLDADIRIGYFPRSTAGGLWKQYVRYGAGRAMTCRKHRIRPALRQMIPVVHVLLLALALLALPWTGVFLLWPLLYLLVILSAGAGQAVRHRSPCGLLGAPALAIMHLAWGLGFLGRIGRPVTAAP